MRKILLLICIFICTSAFAANDVLIFSTNMGKSTQLSKAAELIKIAKNKDLGIDFKFDTEIKKENRLKEFNKYKVVIFDSLSGARGVGALLDKNEKIISSLKKDIIFIPLAIEKKSPYRKNISLEDNINLNKYWSNGGIKNFKNFVLFMNNKILKKSNEKFEKAIIIPKSGIYHPLNPNLVFSNLDEYAKFFQINLENIKKPIIAIGMHKGSVVSNSLDHINQLIKYFDEKGFNTIAFYTEVASEDFVGKRFLKYKNKTIVDVLVNFQIMIIDHESLKKDYKELNIPILHALKYTDGDEKKWREDKIGVRFPMLAMTYVIPETLGFTDPLVVATQNKKTKKIEAIPEQLLSLANKAMNISNLKQKSNKDKKIAIMYYNYPAGINNMGASFLNTPKTLELLIKNLKDKSYTTEEKTAEWFEKEASKSLMAYYEKAKDKEMLKNGFADLYPYEKYIKYFRKLPLETQKTINKSWKSPRYSKMITRVNGKRYFLIPRIQLGNIVILPQSRRSERVDKIGLKMKQLKDEDKNLWHNPKVPVSHSYLASYLYLQDQFNADALIHLGTHGTQEWMPGKEKALSVYDSALLPLGDIPIIYPYITNNVAEAIQAKRRGRATLISHQTPPFSLSGTYKEIGEIMDYINQYKSVDQGMLKSKLQKQITDLSIKLSIHKDVEFSLNEIKIAFDLYVSKVEDYILGMSGTAQPLGMHTFGTYPKEEYLITTIMQMLGTNFMKEADGDLYFAKDYKEIKKSNAFLFIQDYVINNKDTKDLENKDLLAYLSTAKEYVDNFKNNEETKNLLRALDGEYIEPGIGGDPIRNPKSVPTGKNMYGFDPNKIPTKAAYETGVKLMKDFIANYYKENGKYPTKLTFNLWSLETMRNYGVLEGQILYAMGVKPIWNETGISNVFIQSTVKQFLQNYLGQTIASFLSKAVTISRIEFLLNLTPDDWLKKPKKMIRHAYKVNKGKIEDVEIIPYKDLKRPRIDTVISITGLYRDTFPQAMLLLSKAVEKVSDLKEEHNNIRINTLKIQEELKKKNLKEEDIKRLSTIRIFSNKSGSYGSGLDAVADTAKWDDEKRLTDNFFEQRGYYFGSDITHWNEKMPKVDLFAQNLSGTQSVIFSRSSNLYGLLTSDDPFAFFGGISLAIRKLDGESPKTYITNLRDPNNARMQSTAEFVSQELRSRYFHPKWIKAMKEEGYSGANNVADVVSNFWGWQVVDSNVVRDDQWNEFVDVYIDDKYNLDLRKWFEENNANALAQMTEKMIEAYRKGYWKADEKTIKKLLKVYKDLEKDHKVKSYNLDFNEFKKKADLGFGLASLQKIAKNTNQSKNLKEKMLKNKTKPKIKGQKLEEVKNKKKKEDNTNNIIIMFLIFLMLYGLVKELRKKD